ncbi:MAG TPA: DUF952 domain-containing protein [Kofleriaceae bacterium]|nr:DUF952 domain-containing protein [Kofleriaceae bacterium]
MTRLFHIAAAAEWQAARATGVYRPASLDAEGFIHLSTDTQWEATARRFFRGRTDLVLLAIWAHRADIRFEQVDGVPFPHLFGPLAVADVLDACPLAPSFEVPAEIAAWRAFHHAPPRVVGLPPEYIAAVRAADDGVQDVALVAVREHGRPAFYVCLGAKPGREGRLSMRLPLRVPVRFVDRTGTLQMRAFPRTPPGDIDEVALLAFVHAVVEHD